MHSKLELSAVLLVVSLATLACRSKSDSSASGDVSAYVGKGVEGRGRPAAPGRGAGAEVTDHCDHEMPTTVKPR